MRRRPTHCHLRLAEFPLVPTEQGWRERGAIQFSQHLPLDDERTEPDAKPNGHPAENPDNSNEDGNDFLDWLRTWGDLVAQTIMAVGTLGILYFTGRGLLYIIRTHEASKLTLLQTGRATIAAKKQANIAKDIGEKQIAIAEQSAADQLITAQTAQASLVVVKGITAVINNRLSGESVDLQYQNIGKSAAFNIQFGADVFLGDLSDVLVSPHISKPNGWNNFLYSDETKSCWFGFDRSRMITDYKPPSHFTNSRPYLFVAGAILWKDVFHKWRGTRFNYCTPFVENGPLDRFTPAMAGNEILEPWQIQALLHTFYKKQRLRFANRPEMEEAGG